MRAAAALLWVVGTRGCSTPHAHTAHAAARMHARTRVHGTRAARARARARVQAPPHPQHVQCECNDKKGSLAPGMAEVIEVEFCPTEYRYYHDNIRIHSEVRETMDQQTRKPWQHPHPLRSG